MNLVPGQRSLRNEPRLFRAFVVGLPKTGTTSMGGIFSAYRTGHEFMFLETLAALVQRERGQLSPGAFRDFLLHRDRCGAMEMDSTSFAFPYAEILAEEFPEARFVLTIRDCYSWLDSLLNHALSIGAGIDPGLITFANEFAKVPLRPEMLTSRQSLEENLPLIFEGYMRYWSRGNSHALISVPKERLLVVRTHELSSSLPQLAAFVGVPEETLVRDQVHLYKGFGKYPFLGSLPPDLVEEAVETHCSTVMQTIFPGYCLAEYLNGQKPGPLSAP